MTIYAFAGFEFCSQRGVLRHQGEEIPLRPKVVELLNYLLENHGELIPREKLLEALWPDVVVTEDSLTQCLIPLRKALNDDDRSIIRTIPRRGLIFDAPVSTVSENGKAQPRQQQHKWLLAAGTPVVILLLGWSLIVAFSMQAPSQNDLTPSADASAPRSIAVLPFTATAGSSDADYLSTGIAEAIRAQLRIKPELTVTLRHSSNQFQNAGQQIEEVARQLQVERVLTGEISTDGADIELFARLYAGEDGELVWSDAYTGKLANLQNLIVNIADSALIEMRVPLGSGTTAVTKHSPNPEAYNWVLKGQFRYNTRAVGDIELAREYFRIATELDPDYALAWARLAATLRLLYYDGQIDYEELIRVGIPAINRAMELRPDLSEVQFRAGDYSAIVGDFSQAKHHYDLAMTLEPENELNLGYALGFALFNGEREKALDFARRAVQLDPLSPIERTRLINVLFYNQRFDELESEASIASRLNPVRQDIFLGDVLRAYLLQGKVAEAHALLEDIEDPTDRDQAIALLSQWPEYGLDGQAAIERLSHDPSLTAAFRLAEVFAFKGQTSDAFSVLEKAHLTVLELDQPLQEQAPELIVINSPFLDDLRDDSRWISWADLFKEVYKFN